jgi:hypothetical protein
MTSFSTNAASAQSGSGLACQRRRSGGSKRARDLALLSRSTTSFRSWRSVPVIRATSDSHPAEGLVLGHVPRVPVLVAVVRAVEFSDEPCLHVDQVRDPEQPTVQRMDRAVDLGPGQAGVLLPDDAGAHLVR